MLFRAVAETLGAIALVGGFAWLAQPVIAAFKRRQKKFDKDDASV